MPRALLIQLARLGDLVQSLPVLAALHARAPDRPLDLLCPAPLAPVAKKFPGISQVYSWDSQIWNLNDLGDGVSWEGQVRHMREVWTKQAFPAYPVAYNLNNHPRSILAAHLLGDRVIGPGAWGPVHPRLPPWGDYLRRMGQFRGSNRIHLSDAFCGLCQVRPPRTRPSLGSAEMEMPVGFEWLNDRLRYLVQEISTASCRTQTGQLNWNVSGLVGGLIILLAILTWGTR